METTKCEFCGEDIALGKKALHKDHKWVCEDCISELMVDVEDELYDEVRYLRERKRREGY